MSTETVTATTAKIVSDLARASTEPHALEPGGYYVVVTEHGVEQIDLAGDKYRETPQRKTGHVFVRDVASLAHYFAKHSDASSEVFADLDGATITAVLDAHLATEGTDPEFAARWEEHRVTLALQQTEPWKAWTGMSGRLVSQQQFAEFLEANALDVAGDGPVSAADLLEIAQHFHAAVGTQFESGQRLADGQTQLVYIEKIEAKAGQRGELKIPSSFELGIVPYEDCDPRRVVARFRYRVSQGQLSLGFTLDDPARIARAAVAEIVAKAAEATGAVIMQGHPA